MKVLYLLLLLGLHKTCFMFILLFHGKYYLVGNKWSTC